MIQFDVNGRFLVWDQHDINVMKDIPFVSNIFHDGRSMGDSWHCDCCRCMTLEINAKKHQEQHAIQKINVLVNKEFKDFNDEITFVNMFEDSEDSFDKEDIFPEIA